MSKKSKSIRTSLSLPANLLKAMEIVRSEKRVYKSHQIELGLLLYFEKEHRALLESKGMHLWKGK